LEYAATDIAVLSTFQLSVYPASAGQHVLAPIPAGADNERLNVRRLRELLPPAHQVNGYVPPTQAIAFLGLLNRASAALQADPIRPSSAECGKHARPGPGAAAANSRSKAKDGATLASSASPPSQKGSRRQCSPHQRSLPPEIAGVAACWNCQTSTPYSSTSGGLVLHSPCLVRNGFF